MDPFFARMQIIDGPLPIVLLSIAVVLIILLVLRRRRTAGRKWPLTVAVALIIGAAVGLGAC